MKTIKIGDKSYKLFETAEDLSARRYAQLKEFLIQKETGASIQSISETFQRFVKNYDQESKAGMLLTLANYLTGLKQVEALEDADQMIFTLICVEEGEDITKYDKTQAKEKLERFNSQGLTQGLLAPIVLNFIKDSPTLLNYYLTMGLMGLEEKR